MMPERTNLIPEETLADPRPDPWIPPGQYAAQALSIGTGIGGAGLLAGAQPEPETVGGMITLFPDPTQLFVRVANVLGFHVDTSSAWTFGLALVILSLALNIYSFVLRYQYAQKALAEWEERERARQTQLAQVTAGTDTFARGDA